MRHIVLLTTAFLLLSVGLSAQNSIGINLNVTSTAKIPGTSIKKGQTFTISSVTCDMSKKKGYEYVLDLTDAEGYTCRYDLSEESKIPVDFNVNDKDEYWYASCITNSLPNLSKMRDAYSMRSNAEVLANKYIKSLSDNNLVISDPYLASYIYSILLKISPVQRLDFFQYDFRVIISKDETPNACIFPNGALVVNSGLLARLHTEDELVAVLSHEANHFICNHYLDNLAKKQKRSTVGVIGSAIAGAATGVLLGSVNLGVSIASTALVNAEAINELISDIGLAFNQTQERESDQAAVELLGLLGYDTNAMATAIKSIGDYYKEEGNLAAYYRSGNYPKIEDRIAVTGSPYERRDSTFEKRMAVCVSHVAQQKFAKGRYNQSLSLVNQNIGNDAGLGMDYYLKGECLLATADVKESNQIARECLLKARETYPQGLPTLKALIVTDLRLDLKDEAKALLEEFDDLAKNNEVEQAWAKNMLANL